MIFDVCMTVSRRTDVLCLDALLYSLRRFGDTRVLNLLVSVNSSESGYQEVLQNTCAAYDIRSLHVDAFSAQVSGGALQHGESLNRLIGMTTANHVFFMDPDIILTSPRLWPYCLENIEGKFMVGTPYHDAQARVVWRQGTFPNIWFAVVDGCILRRSNVDMRPDLLQKNVGIRDTGWELAEYAYKHGYEKLEFFAGGGSRKNRGRNLGCAIGQWGRRHLSGVSAVECAAVAGVLREVSPLEFRLPGGRETCCLHLLHAHRPDRVEAWLRIAKRVVDLCALMAEEPHD